jgi:hypothetical protein
MNLLERDVRPALLRWEFPVIGLLAWLAFVSIPLSLGEIGISWDALNHQIYLGWTAAHSRFDRDFLAASYQSYQFPYLYWPVYKLSASGLSGAWSGAVLATLNWLAVPPVWMMARACIPGARWFDVFMRILAVVLAFLTGLVLSLFDSTSNDLLAAIPFVWALALALEPLSKDGPQKLCARNAVLLSGLFAGVSVACKLSNGPLALLLPGLWVLSASSIKERMRNAILGGAATVAAFVLAYGYWGWELWTHFGNPVYPFGDAWFAPLRTLLGWQP